MTASMTAPSIAAMGVHRFCVAPMMDWTDRHCRFFHRQLSQHAFLYTEMVTTGALLRGDIARHLDFSAVEHPVGLQVGGSDPEELAQVSRLAQRWGYDEINLNCGCPSERVQKGSFGACLMREPILVSDCIKSMVDAVSIPVTVKHRIGVDREESYEFVRDFVGQVSEAGASCFVVHARNAWLHGLSPRENREVPPLRYAFVRQLKRDFPTLEFVLNGGLSTVQQAHEELSLLDGVMLGRAVYHDPFLLSQVDQVFFGATGAAPTRTAVAHRMQSYCEQYAVPSAGGPHRLRHVVRHMLGLFLGCPGARTWRRMLSDARLLDDDDASLISEALQMVEDASVLAA